MQFFAAYRLFYSVKISYNHKLRQRAERFVSNYKENHVNKDRGDANIKAIEQMSDKKLFPISWKKTGIWPVYVKVEASKFEKNSRQKFDTHRILSGTIFEDCL